MQFYRDEVYWEMCASCISASRSVVSNTSQLICYRFFSHGFRFFRGVQRLESCSLYIDMSDAVDVTACLRNWAFVFITLTSPIPVWLFDDTVPSLSGVFLTFVCESACERDTLPLEIPLRRFSQSSADGRAPQPAKGKEG